jgi:hypothetical protein
MREGEAQAEGAAMKPAEGAAVYRYTDGGRVVIVDSLSRVPARLRGSVEVIPVEGPGTLHLPELRELPERIHWPSFMAGAGTALVLTFAVLALRRRVGGVLRWALVAGVLALAAGAYFGWLRRLGGQSEQLLASPQRLIEDARANVQRLNERSREQERVLRELGAEH